MSLSQSVESATTVIKELNYSLPPKFFVSRAYEVRIKPTNSGVKLVPGNEVTFSLPNPMNSYIDPQSSYLRFRAKYTPVTPASGCSAVLLSSAYSHFSNFKLVGSNTAVADEIVSYNVVVNNMIQAMFSASEKNSLSTAYGFDETNYGSVKGCNISSVTGPVYKDYCIPIIGAFLGVNNTKYFPVSKLSELNIVYTMAQLKEIILNEGIVPGSNIESIELDDMELVMDYIVLNQDTEMIVNQIPPRLKSNSYLYTSFPLDIGYLGTFEFLVGLRCNSLKSIWLQPCPADYPEGSYCGINPNLESMSYTLNGIQFPSSQLMITQRPADIYMQTLKSWNAVNKYEINGSMSDSYFKVRELVDNLNMWRVGSTSKPDFIANTQCNNFRIGLNCETNSNDNTLLNGLDISNTNSYVRLTINQALTKSYRVHIMANYDKVMYVDPMTRTFQIFS